MATIGLFEVIDLKKELDKRFGAKLHMHDTCGGQSFTLEKSSDEIQEYIKGFFDKQKVEIKFSSSGLDFYTV